MTFYFPKYYLEVIKWAKRTPNTPGQITQVYFYQRGGVVPHDGLTIDATSVWNAQEMLYEMSGLSKWRYAMVSRIITLRALTLLQTEVE